MTDFLKKLLTDLPWSDEFAKRLWEAHEWQEMHVEDPKIGAERAERAESSAEEKEDFKKEFGFDPISEDDAEILRENIRQSRGKETPHFTPERRMIELLERQVELLEALVAAEFSSQQTTDRMLKLFLSSAGGSSESDPFKAFSAQRLLGGNGLRNERNKED